MKRQIVEVFSIGHSNLSYRKFAALLRKWEIEQVIDVRSIPYSKYVPHFNFEVLKRKLGNSKIEYEYLGNQLGSRNTRMRGSEEGISDYRRQMATDAFDEGIEQVLQLASEKRVAIMCAESDPYKCHRHTVLATELAKHGVSMLHILKSGHTHSAFNGSIERRLKTNGSGQRGLFDVLQPEPMGVDQNINDPLPQVA